MGKPAEGAPLRAAYTGCGAWSRRIHTDCSAPAAGLSRDQPLEKDPVLTFISSYLASRQPAATGSSSGSAVPSMGSGSAAPLALAEWQVDWKDICLERQIGRGAYGRVSGLPLSLPPQGTACQNTAGQ